MFLNLSNHPSQSWSEAQLTAAKEYGEIQDMPFPAIDADADEKAIMNLVVEYFDKIITLSKGNKVTVHLMGEMTFCFTLVAKLKVFGITCVAACSERNVVDFGNGKKEVEFNFVRFRKY